MLVPRRPGGTQLTGMHYIMMYASRHYEEERKVKSKFYHRVWNGARRRWDKGYQFGLCCGSWPELHLASTFVYILHQPH